MANIVKASVDVTIEEIVATEVQEVLTSEQVVPPTIWDRSGEVGPGMDKLKMPLFANFTAVDKVAGTPLTFQDNVATSDDLDLDKHQHVPFLIEDIAALQSKVAVAQLLVRQAGRDLAAKMDADVITAINAGPSAAAPDHIVAFDSGTALSKNDVLKARELLNAANAPASERTLLTDPSQESNLMKIAEFTRVDESGGSAALRNGMIGRLFGFDVIMSSQASTDPLFYHRMSAAFARQQTPSVEQDRSLEDVGTKWRVGHLWGVKAGLNGGKLAVKINATGM